MIHVEKGEVTLDGLNSGAELVSDFLVLCKTLETEGILEDLLSTYEMVKDDKEAFQLVASVKYKK